MTIRSFLFAIFLYSHLLYAFFLPPIKIPSFLPSVDMTKYIDIREPLESPISTFPISGFYGLIGPHIDYKTIYSLYDLFTGDGIIQGIFLENGTATFVQTLVKTEKLAFETTYGKMPKHMVITMLASALYHMHFLPNMIGVANTAFMTVNNRTFALFERDMPYELAVDFKNKEVRTIGRYNIPFLSTFSGHSKVVQCPKDTEQLMNTQGGHSKIIECTKGHSINFKNAQGGHSKVVQSPKDTEQHKDSQGNIETIEYHVLQQKVIWYQMDTDFKKTKQYSLPMKYMPMTHDFYSDEQYVIIIDSPILIDWNNLSNSEIPMHFNEDLPTYIYILHKDSGKIEQYISKESFYLFHYGSVQITDDSIIILAPFYDTMNYNTIHHSGKYRKLYIDRKIGVSHFIKMKIVEDLNLDFPVRTTKNRIILRSIQNNRINGFYIFNDLQIVKKMIWTDRFICGEPAISYLKPGEPILLCFAFSEKSKQQFFMTIHLETYEIVEYFISHPLFVGFHATFIENSK
jgi:Retinal pigment epithelial membrane protein